MPKLLPPSDGESILGDIIDEVDGTAIFQETGRQNVLEFEDATKVVSSLSLALGICFLVTTASLYAYYYSFTFDPINRRKKRSLPLTKDNATLQENKSQAFLSVMSSLEEAFRKWGVSEKECRKKMICEAFRSPNDKSSQLKKEIRKIFLNSQRMLSSKDPNMEEKAGEFIEASEIGKAKGNCKKLFRRCKISTDDLFSMIKL